MILHLIILIRGANFWKYGNHFVQEGYTPKKVVRGFLPIIL
jgi:hypothetical protein